MNSKSTKTAPKKGLWAPIAFVLTLIWVIVLSIGAGISFVGDLLVRVLMFVVKTGLFLAWIANRMWNRTSRWFKRQWKVNYVRLTQPNPTCEICHKSNTGQPVTFSDCCGRFVHDQCHKEETMKRMPAELAEFLRTMSEALGSE